MKTPKDDFPSPRAIGYSETFKTQIDLRQSAVGVGFILERTKGSRRSAVMRHGADKIIINLDAGDSHFTYFTVHDERDNGSILDFVMRRKRMKSDFPSPSLDFLATLIT